MIILGKDFENLDKFLKWTQSEGYYFYSSKFQEHNRYRFHRKDVTLSDSIRESKKYLRKKCIIYF